MGFFFRRKKKSKGSTKEDTTSSSKSSSNKTSSRSSRRSNRRDDPPSHESAPQSSPAAAAPVVANSSGGGSGSGNSQRRSITAPRRRPPSSSNISNSRHHNEYDSSPNTTSSRTTNSRVTRSTETPRQTMSGNFNKSSDRLVRRHSIDAPPPPLPKPSARLPRRDQRNIFSTTSAGSSSPRDPFTSTSSTHSMPDPRGIPALPLGTQRNNQQQPPKSKKSQQQQGVSSSNHSSSPHSQSSPGGLSLEDGLSLLSSTKSSSSTTSPNNNNNNNNNKISSTTSVNTIDSTTSRTATQLQELIDQMQSEVTKLRSTKHAAECKSNRLETEMITLQQDYDSQILRLITENERLKGVGERDKVRVGELERENESLRLIIDTLKNSGSKSGIPVKTKKGSSLSDRSTRNSSKEDRSSTSNNKAKQSSFNASSSSIASFKSNRSNKSQTTEKNHNRSSKSSKNHRGGGGGSSSRSSTPASQRPSQQSQQQLPISHPTPTQSNKRVITSSSSPSSLTPKSFSRLPSNGSTTRNTSFSSNDNDNDNQSSSSEDTFGTAHDNRTVDASSCASPHPLVGDGTGIWTSNGIQSGPLVKEMQENKANKSPRLDELVVDELYYA